MPLIDLKTDLKSLRYGKDRPGGGSSPEPFIRTSLQDSFDIPTEELGNNGGKDWVLRGGSLALQRSGQDMSRLLKWGDDNSLNATLFTAKQNSLAAQGQQIGAGGPTKGVNGEGIYFPTNTLAQVGVNAFGGHANKQGANPFPLDKNYTIFGKQINANNLSGGRDTYLVDYMNNPKNPAIEPEYNRLVYLADTSFQNNTGILFKYPGGPDAVGGVIGNTKIKFSKGNRTGEANPLRVTSPTKFYGTYKPAFEPGKYLISVGNGPENTGVSGKYRILTGQLAPSGFNIFGQDLKQVSVYTQGNTFPDMDTKAAFTNGSATLTQEQLIDKTPISKGGQLSDFRKSITVNQAIAKINGVLTSAPDYQTVNIDAGASYINYYSPGSKNRNRSNYSEGSGGVVDALNALYMYKSNEVRTEGTQDLIPFRFAVIDPDDPDQKTFVHFRSYFDGNITDNYTGKWDSFKYQGRAEDFYHYSGFDRTMGFSFKVAVQSKNEQANVYRKLNYLQSSLAPNYSNSGYMRGNIHQVTIGGYISEQPGIITSINFTLPNVSPWEIGIDTTGKPDESVSQLSHMIEVSVTFKPIHTFLPQIVGSALSSNGIDDPSNTVARFMTLSTNSGSLYDLSTELSYPTTNTTPTEEQQNQLDATIANLENLDRG